MKIKMNNTLIKILRGFAAFLIIISYSEAQTGFAVGPKFGIINSSFSGNSIGDIENRTSFLGGAFVIIHMTENFAIQPEIVFNRNGAVQTKNNIRTDLSLTYFSIPVLAKLRLPVGEMIKPNIFIGPNFSVRTNSKVSTIDTRNDAVIDANIGSISSGDMGFTAGIGMDIQYGLLYLTADSRYNYGFIDIGSSGENYNFKVKNTGLAFSVGLALMFGDNGENSNEPQD